MSRGNGNPPVRTGCGSDSLDSVDRIQQLANGTVVEVGGSLEQFLPRGVSEDQVCHRDLEDLSDLVENPRAGVHESSLQFRHVSSPDFALLHESVETDPARRPQALYSRADSLRERVWHTPMERAPSSGFRHGLTLAREFPIWVRDFELKKPEARDMSTAGAPVDEFVGFQRQTLDVASTNEHTCCGTEPVEDVDPKW
jgi:hypothetical protein